MNNFLRNVIFAAIVALLFGILVAIFIGGPLLERLEGLMP